MRRRARPEHCWHATGVVFTSMPPQRQEICCECGDTRNVTDPAPEDVALHGPFHPGAHRTIAPTDPTPETGDEDG